PKKILNKPVADKRADFRGRPCIECMAHWCPKTFPVAIQPRRFDCRRRRNIKNPRRNRKARTSGNARRLTGEQRGLRQPVFPLQGKSIDETKRRPSLNLLASFAILPNR